MGRARNRSAPDRSQAVTASVVGKPTVDEARKAALSSCRSAKSGSDQARSACVVVGTFQNECFAFAEAKWVLAATEQAARVQASANVVSRKPRGYSLSRFALSCRCLRHALIQVMAGKACEEVEWSACADASWMPGRSKKA